MTKIPFFWIKWVLLIPIWACSNILISQNPTPQPELAKGPEKIYLQLTSKEYTANETIWFKAIVVESQTHQPSSISGVLNVDFIGPNGKLVAHKLIRLKHGMGHGHFDLKPNQKGRFLIRAYTQWNQNFGADFIYHQYLNIYSLQDDAVHEWADEIRTVENIDGQLVISGKLNLNRELDLNPSKTKLHVQWDKGKAEVAVTKDEANEYQWQVAVPNNISWIELKTTNRDQKELSKTIVLDQQHMDFQFFPEGGKLIHGFQNKIGFKALGFDGKGRPIEGQIFDNQGNKITNIRSNGLGMGYFYMVPDRAKSYHAKIKHQGSPDHDLNYGLPLVSPSGTLFAVHRLQDKIGFQIASHTSMKKIAIKASCRGADYYLIEGELKDGSLKAEMQSEMFPEGIIVFTLIGENGEPIAERLHYNESNEDDLSVKVNMDQSNFTRRDPVHLDFQFSNSQGDPIQGNASILVIKSDQWRGLDQRSIYSYFNLESELRGPIERPSQYFDQNNPKRLEDMEALLLTQGWRNYKYPARRDSNTFFWPEPGLTVRGKALPFSPKVKSDKVVDLTLASFARETKLYTETADSTGVFQFVLDDTYGNDMRILITALNAQKGKNKLKISHNKYPKPEIEYKHDPFAFNLDTIAKTRIDNQKEMERLEMVFDSLYGVTQLDEVIVEDIRLKPERKELYNRYGTPDVVISGDSLVKKEKDWSYGLYSVLMFNYRDQVIIEQFADGFMLAHVRGEPTLLMVDSQLLQKEQYQHVSRMPPGIIEDIEIIQHARSFRSSYLEVFPDTNPMFVPAFGHIISVFTKGGVGLQGMDRPIPGTLDTTIKVFSPVKEFYRPQYDGSMPTNEQKPDLRSLVHWNPLIETDQEGTGSDSFYLGDAPGEYVLILEAISNEGLLVHKQQTFTVSD